MAKIKEKKLLSKEDIAQEVSVENAYKDIDVQSEVHSPDEATAKAISELTSTKNIETMSHFTDSEIKQLSFMHTFAQEYNITLIKTYAQKFGKYRISLNRKGRGEVVDISKEKKQSGFPLNLPKLNRI